MIVVASDSVIQLADGPIPLAVRIVMSSVLITAGFLKLWQPNVAAEALVSFRVARVIRPGLARALGVAEAISGLSALVFSTHRAGAIAATALFGAFLILVTRAIRSGETFNCGCFGSKSEDIGLVTLFRAAILFAVGVVAIAIPAQAVGSGSRLANAIVIAAASIGSWSLVSAYLRSASSWRIFLADAIDWPFAAQLHPEAAPKIMATKTDD